MLTSISGDMIKRLYSFRLNLKNSRRFRLSANQPGLKQFFEERVRNIAQTVRKSFLIRSAIEQIILIYPLQKRLIQSGIVSLIANAWPESVIYWLILLVKGLLVEQLLFKKALKGWHLTATSFCLEWMKKKWMLD